MKINISELLFCRQNKSKLGQLRVLIAMKLVMSLKICLILNKNYN